MQTQKSRIVNLAIVLFVMILPWPHVAEAQQTKKVPRIGMLVSGTASSQKTWLDAFRQGLRTLGYVEGQNIIIERRDPEGRAERYPELAASWPGLKWMSSLPEA